MMVRNSKFSDSLFSDENLIDYGITVLVLNTIKNSLYSTESLINKVIEIYFKEHFKGIDEDFLKILPSKILKSVIILNTINFIEKETDLITATSEGYYFGSKEPNYRENMDLHTGILIDALIEKKFFDPNHANFLSEIKSKKLLNIENKFI